MGDSSPENSPDRGESPAVDVGKRKSVDRSSMTTNESRSPVEPPSVGGSKLSNPDDGGIKRTAEELAGIRQKKVRLLSDLQTTWECHQALMEIE